MNYPLLYLSYRCVYSYLYAPLKNSQRSFFLKKKTFKNGNANGKEGDWEKSKVRSEIGSIHGFPVIIRQINPLQKKKKLKKKAPTHARRDCQPKKKTLNHSQPPQNNALIRWSYTYTITNSLLYSEISAPQPLINHNASRFSVFDQPNRSLLPPDHIYRTTLNATRPDNTIAGYA
jgi:hypothetical protein